jgi:hypothetical protein
MALTAGMVIGGGSANADPSASVPSADQLTAQLSAIFDVNGASVQRASYLEAGDAALPLADSVGRPMAEHRSMVSMYVEDPARNGDRLSSELVVSVMGIGTQRRPLVWIERGGTWTLSTDSLCAIYTEASKTSSCPLHES